MIASNIANRKSMQIYLLVLYVVVIAIGDLSQVPLVGQHLEDVWLPFTPSNSYLVSYPISIKCCNTHIVLKILKTALLAHCNKAHHDRNLPNKAMLES